VSGFAFLFYVSAGVVYFAVVATIWGFFLSARRTKPDDSA
jgi:hypothetical protein